MHIPRWPRHPPRDGAPADAKPGPPPLEYGDGWSRAVRGPFLDPDRFQLLDQLLKTDRGSSPFRSGVWRELTDEIATRDNRPVRDMLAAMLAALAEGAPQFVPGDEQDGRALLVGRANAVRAVNTIWASAWLEVPEAIPLTGQVLIRAITEPWTMDSYVRIRSAAQNVLVQDGGQRAVSALTAAVPLAPNSALREQLSWGLSIASIGSRTPPSRVAELRVDRHGLDDDGERQLVVDRRRSTVRISPDGRVTIAWVRPQGSKTFAATLATQAEGRAVRATYRKELIRIEGLLATDREWPLAEWRRLYLENPITRAVAARTVWDFRLPDERRLSVLPDWHRQIRAVDGRSEPADWPAGPGTTVRLWHPREAPADQIAAWRALLAQGVFVQPFAQIERDFTRIEPDPDAVELRQCAGIRLTPAALSSLTRRMHWYSRRKSTAARSDGVRLICREFPDADLTIGLTCLRNDDLVELGTGWFYRSGSAARIPLPLDSVPARVYSETLRDLAVLARDPGPETEDDGDGINDLVQPDVSDAVP